MHGLEAEYGDRVHFVYLDIDDPATDAFKQQLGYRLQPHFFLLDSDGVTLQDWQGRISEADFQAAFDEKLGD